MQSRRVVFPEPFGPIKAQIPGSTSSRFSWSNIFFSRRICTNCVWIIAWLDLTFSCQEIELQAIDEQVTDEKDRKDFWNAVSC